MTTKMTAKDAKRIVKKRNQLKSQLAKAEKHLMSDKLTNFAKNQAKMLSIRQELIEQHESFVKAFKFFVGGDN